LHTALAGSGSLLVMNYYNPYVQQCAGNPAVAADLQTFNGDLQSDATSYGVPVADVYDQFTPGQICVDTWMCSVFNDIHATSTGYGLIAAAFESAYGY